MPHYEDLTNLWTSRHGPQRLEQFSHGYYQGLLVEIGKFRRLTTYVPAQDQNRLFIDKKLGEITDTTELPDFTYDDLKRYHRVGSCDHFSDIMGAVLCYAALQSKEPTP